MRFFVTGIGGFAGVHLAAHLLAAGHDVVGTVTARRDRPRLRALVERYPRFALDRLAAVDVTDRVALEHALVAARPDGIFHLAGIAFAPRATADPGRTFAVNVLGTINLLAAAAAVVPASRILVAGSGDAYGAVAPADLAVGEDTPLRPVSVYGVSKAAADMAAFQQWWTAGVPVVRARAFNHTGPGQGPEFVCSDFARQIVRIAAGGAPPVLEVGNLEAVRDFSDVRDVVRGYLLLWERGTPGEAYNLCSGVGTRIASIVETLAAASGTAVTCNLRPERLRAREVPALVGSPARANALGWAPAIPLDQTLRDLLADWRARLDRTPDGG